MSCKLTILPSRHEFDVEKHETVLEAALKAGLSVDYGCSNGSCGKCQAKLVSGETEKMSHQDFVFSEAEKMTGSFLMCCNGLASDSVIETPEASGSNQIEQQCIQVKIKKVESPAEGIKILHVRSPRAQRLRYLAGQHVRLVLEEQSRTVSIASCPCDAMNQQFHIAVDTQDAFYQRLFDGQNPIQSLQIEGPGGSFTLTEQRERPILFIAHDTGFGPVKGLIEHALSLELPQQLMLIWLADTAERHYMHNYCRSIADAVDNFSYFHPCVAKSDDTEAYANELADVLQEHVKNTDLGQSNIYLSARPAITRIARQCLLDAGADEASLVTESL